jgi:hypothetical protein
MPSTQDRNSNEIGGSYDWSHEQEVPLLDKNNFWVLLDSGAFKRREPGISPEHWEMYHNLMNEPFA